MIKNKKIIMSLFLAFLLALPINTSVKASTLNIESTTITPRDTFKGKWTTNIKIYINTFDSSIRSPFLVAIDEWNSILSEIGSKIKIETVYQQSSANTVLNVKEFGGQYTAFGVSYPEGASIFTSGEIGVNANKFINDNDIIKRANIARHEIGHILGLAHTTGGQSSVMDAEIASYNKIMKPTSYDKSELKSKYK